MRPTPKICRVPGCDTPDVTNASKYCCRHRVCENHKKVLFVEYNGTFHRFCQNCTRFHEVNAFDNTRHNCRAALKKCQNRQQQLRELKTGWKTKSKESSSSCLELNLELPEKNNGCKADPLHNSEARAKDSFPLPGYARRRSKTQQDTVKLEDSSTSTSESSKSGITLMPAGTLVKVCGVFLSQVTKSSSDYECDSPLPIDESKKGNRPFNLNLNF
mmetsp:Transcript_29845/g.41267  ORF Transcript_29845/g.41267 Transcript_29845/m.41267 type:complete len:216 (+) Transcript_29845:201-848(+)